MGLLSFLSGSDWEQGLKQFHDTPGSLLLDVRTAEEHRSGHVPESRNIPLHLLREVERQIPNRDTPLFVYCQSGVRSRQAARQLKAMGYPFVIDLGGISGYRGDLVK